MITPRRIVNGLARRAERLVRGRPTELALLEMVWPTRLLSSPPAISIFPGYRLKQFQTPDRDRYFALLAAADMDACRLEYWEQHILPDGFFVVEHDASGALAAACFASHHPAPRHPRAGNLGWLAGHPEHKGKQLGRAVAAAVTARLIDAGYKRIYLETHDFRVPAITIYLKMGWVPLLYRDDMHDRWKAVCAVAGWPFTPAEWTA